MSGENCESKPNQQIDRDIRSEAAEASSTKMKITDLTIICLEEIFEYLDLENLLNVADSNKRLNIAACFVFRRKHEKKEIVLHRIKGESIESLDKRVWIGGTNINFRFLRCFGCVTLDLRIHFGDSSQEQVDTLCFYINEYCAESLIKLTIFGSHVIFTQLQKPFLNIEIVSFRCCNLGTNVMQFDKWFTKMQRLELHNNQMVGKECMEMHSPNLRHLTYRPKLSDIKYFARRFENIIRLNPTLRSLWIHNWSAKVFQNINKYLPQLEVLTIETLRGTGPDYEIGQVHFKNLKKFEIYTSWKRSDFLSKIDFIFDQLEEFHVRGIKFNNLLTFVKKYSTIKKLKLNYINDFSKENALQVAKALPLLSELHLILGKTFSVGEIIRYVDELNKVEKIYCQIDDLSKVEDLRTKLSSKWNVSIVPETFRNLIILQRVIN